MSDDTEPHVEVAATITDRWGGVETVYAGSMPEWAWADTTHWRVWTRDRRRLILADRTADPRGWRVTFVATPPE